MESISQAFEWVRLENPVALWWLLLAGFSTLNMAFWLWTRVYFRNSASMVRSALIGLSAIYVFGCAFRSFLPRADVQRIVLFDSWWSSVFVGRTVATFAELAFVAQWAIVLHLVGRGQGNKAIETISKIIFPLIVVAEICSWYAVITTNYLGNTIEESLWTLTYALIGVALMKLFLILKGVQRWAALAGVVGCLLYVGFMVGVDVPMYFTRWQADLATEKPSLSLASGLIDLNSRWHVTHSIEDWQTEIPWMSLYFSFAVWVSLAICYVPLRSTSATSR